MSKNGIFTIEIERKNKYTYDQEVKENSKMYEMVAKQSLKFKLIDSLSVNS